MIRPKFPRHFGAILVLEILAAHAPSPARACAAAAPAVYSAETFIAAERAVILWDQANHVEHFIRQASLQTQSPDLGFLVPTPAAPELAEADPRIFDLAADVGRPNFVPPVEYHTPWETLLPILLGPMNLTGEIKFIRGAPLLSGMSEHAAPTLVFEQDVAGYHAAVLKADDPATLTGWLKQNGYEPPPDFEAWLKPYLAAKWTITAFKLNKNPSGAAGALTTHAIRMSFPTDRPFFPYSEPGDVHRAASASPLGRALRIAILSDQRMQGALADGTPWPGQLEYAGPSAPGPATPGGWNAAQWLAFAGLADGKHDVSLPRELTAFLDESNPRPGIADLYFSSNPDPAPYRETKTDYGLAPLHRVNFHDPLGDATALLAVVLIPGAPLYCGWHLHIRRRAKSAGLDRVPLPSPRARVLDQILGVICVLLGGFYGLQAAFFLLFGATSLLVSGWRDSLAPEEFATPLLGLPAGVGLVLLCWAMISCGLRVFLLASSSAGDRWQGAVAFGALFAGGLLLAIMGGALVSMFTI
ncbi:MAG: DUF2330 domain-containing protein [Verrucomicrobiota bacterium]